MTINDANVNDSLRDFFYDVLLPIAESAQQQGVEFFPLGPEAKADSYYSDLSGANSYLHEIDLSDLGTELRQLWASGDFPDLVKIAAALEKFSKLLKEKADETDEISPFIYAMF